MIIGLMGMEFESENKGCEALSYSFLNILNKIDNENLLIYYFSNLGFGKVQETFPDLKFKRINLKIKDKKLNFFRAAHKCDYIFDVTMGDSFSDIYSKEVCLSDIRFKRIASTLSKKYILLPQTYGPFYSVEAKKGANKVFKNTDMVFCRDELSKEYIEKEFGIMDSILSTDMAFALPFDKSYYSFTNTKKKKIGLNVSGLLFRGGFTKNNQFNLKLDYPELIRKIIESISSEYEIHLIPHVINFSENAHDDDYKTCQLLHEEYPNTILAPAFETPIQAKSYISNMNIFIGSRMHSTVAGFSSGVVTIPISYSRKFEGLFGSLNYPYVVNAKEKTTESAYELILKYIEKKDELSQVQSKSMIIVNQKNNGFKESLARLFQEE